MSSRPRARKSRTVGRVCMKLFYLVFVIGSSGNIFRSSSGYCFY